MNAPPEIGGWNWGAFWLGPIWAVGNRVWRGLLGWLPLALAPTLNWLTFALYGYTDPYGFRWVDVGRTPQAIFCLLIVLAFFSIPFYLISVANLARTGNQLAWEHNRWRSLSQFKTIQRRWAIVGWILGVPVAFLHTIVPFFLFLWIPIGTMPYFM